MERLVQVVLPKEFPKTIEGPVYFLQMIDRPEWLWLFRLLIIAAVILVVGGSIYYEKHPKDFDKRRMEKQQEDGKGEKK